MATNKTEPNKPGLPDSHERGIDAHDTTPGVTAGVGVKNPPIPAVSGSVVDAKKWYRVKGPGSVRINGIDHPAGMEVKLGEADARSVDEHLEEFTPSA
jgi:hypothetical protein